MKLELDGIVLRYGEQPPLLEAVSLAIDAGDFVLIEGPSGCGKSSLLRLLNRLHEPAEGRLLIDGVEASGIEAPRLRRRIAYLQQTPVMLDGTVRDNLLLPFTFRLGQEAAAPDDAALRKHLARFRLTDVELEQQAQQLSVGQQQRLALIRLLLAKPEMLLADEPTSALDADSRQQVVEALEAINVEDLVSVVLVAHDTLTFQRVSPRRFVFGERRRLEEQAWT